MIPDKYQRPRAFSPQKGIFAPRRSHVRIAILLLALQRARIDLAVPLTSLREEQSRVFGFRFIDDAVEIAWEQC